MAYFKINKAKFETILSGGSRFPLDLRDNDERLSPKELKKLAVKKWKFIENYYLKSPTDPLADGGKTTCAFCLVYHDNQCRGCPIAKKSKRIMCENTPYHKYTGLYEKAISTYYVTINTINRKLYAAAKKERKFLEKLKVK